jgi:DNA-binding response OmpR family regulator
VVLAIDPVGGPAMRTILGEHGYDVRIVATIEEALIALKQIGPELVILDHGPDQSGFVLRPKLGGVPVIVCSAEDSVAERVTSLHLGADDFIPKPYDPYEFVERVNAVLRRSQPRDPERPPVVFTMGELVVDLARVEITVCGQPIHLTATEFRILTMLIQLPGRVVSTTEFGNKIWGHVGDGTQHALNVRISTLRKKLDQAGLVNPAIVTNRSHGYSLILRDESDG